MRRLLGYVRYDSEAARNAINDLYRNQLRWFQNLFLPSVKLARKERVGSRLRRHNAGPQTPLQRLAASGAADPAKLAELPLLRDRLDPFQLAARIEAKLKEIFAMSREAPAPTIRLTGGVRVAAEVVAPATTVARSVAGQEPHRGRSGVDSKKKAR